MCFGILRIVRILWSKTTSETGSHRSRATAKHRPLHLRSPPRLALPTPERERVRVLCMVAQLQTIQRSRTLNSIHPPSTNMVSGRCLSEQHNTREIPLSRASPQSERCRSPQQPQRMAVASLCRNTTWAPVPSQVCGVRTRMCTCTDTLAKAQRQAQVQVQARVQARARA